MAATILLATCEAFPHLGPDDAHLLAALAARGHEARAAVWTDEGERWGDAGLVLIRSCWDYYLRGQEFMAWLDRATAQGARIINEPAQIKWNAEKRYLLELEQAGASIIPSVLVERGERVELVGLCEAQGWAEAVIKPTLSANAYETVRGAPGALQAALDAILGRSSALVQPFMPEVVTDGEWSLLCFGGTFSHATLKRPAAADFRVQEVWGGASAPADPPAWLIEQAERIVGLTPGGVPAYARVDGVIRDGSFLLMELEAIEPELFLRMDAPRAARRLVSTIESLL